MRLLGEDVEAAMAAVFGAGLPALSGGAVAVDGRGRLCAAYNTFGMFAALADSSGHAECWDALSALDPARPVRDPH